MQQQKTLRDTGKVAALPADAKSWPYPAAVHSSPEPLGIDRTAELSIRKPREQ